MSQPALKKVNPLSLAQELIAIPSLPGEELQVLHFLERYLSEVGWSVTRSPVDAQTFNIFAGDPKQRAKVLTTHLDVVPVSDTSQFAPRIENEKIIGRGACDAKGIAAAMIAAATEYAAMGNDDVALLFVVGEECDGRGAKAVLPLLRELQPIAIINGEPTENILASAQKGALDFELCVQGKAAHSGYPELGIDANRILFELLSELYAKSWSSGDECFGDTLLNVGVLRGGSAANTVSDTASLSGLLRSGATSDVLRQEVLDLVGVRATVSFRYEASPVQFFVPPKVSSKVFSYVSDAAFYSVLDTKLLQVGPGSIHHAHTEHEYIGTKELEEGVALYKKLLQQL